MRFRIEFDFRLESPLSSLRLFRLSLVFSGSVWIVSQIRPCLFHCISAPWTSVSNLSSETVCPVWSVVWFSQIHQAKSGMFPWSISQYRTIELSNTKSPQLRLILLMALQPFFGPWTLFSFLIFYTVGRTPWTGDQPSQGLNLHIEQHKHRMNAHNTDIHAVSGIRTYDGSVRASEDSSCLRPRGRCDRQFPLRQAYYRCSVTHTNLSDSVRIKFG
jgi:hypothetical protein